MSRLKRSTFALMLCILPACATVIGAVVLKQIPTVRDLAGIALVIAGVALHQEISERKEEPWSTRTSAAPDSGSRESASG
jgi:inner membrane transporter RhtA